ARDLSEALLASLCPAVLDRDRAPIGPPKLTEPMDKGSCPLTPGQGRSCAKESDGRPLGCLLRARRERPRYCRAAEQRYKVAPFQLKDWHFGPTCQGQTAYRIGCDQVRACCAAGFQSG